MKKTAYTYSDLQQHIDTLIGKFGLQHSVEVVASLTNNTALSAPDKEKVKLLLVFTISKSIDIFDLMEANFYTSSVQEYREARMACYFLLKKYTDCSYAKIGERFNQSKRAVLYHYHKCDEMLSIPQYYKPFVDKFKLLEHHIINFIAKLN
jgi:chromosomal replication initiation ATPase DnaA